MTAVLADLDTRDADRIYCLGDVVGYGPDPDACCELVRRRVTAVVAGNHDHAVVGLTDLGNFTPYARLAAEWTAERMGQIHRPWLMGLPLVHSEGDFTLVHASPRVPEAWEYLVAPEDGRENFPFFHTRFCFIGHTHRPMVWEEAEGAVSLRGGNFALNVFKERRCIVNVGSVGQPRDGDPRASYALFDDEAERIQIVRVAYPFQMTQRKMTLAGLPSFLIERLAHGK